MTLAALIAAYHESDEPGGGLRATLPLTGRTLVERQARLVAAAGANPVVLAVERVPQALLAAVDRMRRQGLNIVLARSAEEAAEAVHPGDRLLLVGDGLLAGEGHIARLLSTPGRSILTIADSKADDRYERIDAENRWAGLALIDGDMLKQTAAMLQDWDLQSTLLRRAVQAGARALPLRGEPEDDQLIVAERVADLGELQARIVRGAGALRGDWVSGYLLAPVEQAATRWLMATRATPFMFGMGAVALTLFALLAFASHWYGTGIGLLLVGTLLEGIGDRLTLLRMQMRSEQSWWTYLLPLVSAGALLALSVALMRARGWGCLSLGAGTIAFQVAQHIEAQGRAVSGRVWLAERKGLAWLLLPFAVVGLWGTGLTAIALYAGASFFWVQRQAHRPALVES
ncbi:MAG: hypothetical protein JWO25_3812 [Alphaproteobacteria bacterium]|nr:hypothetical protein [Alphaproteobacteria bacterium]